MRETHSMYLTLGGWEGDMYVQYVPYLVSDVRMYS